MTDDELNMNPIPSWLTLRPAIRKKIPMFPQVGETVKKKSPTTVLPDDHAIRITDTPGFKPFQY